MLPEGHAGVDLGLRLLGLVALAPVVGCLSLVDKLLNLHLLTLRSAQQLIGQLLLLSTDVIRLIWVLAPTLVLASP